MPSSTIKTFFVLRYTFSLNVLFQTFNVLLQTLMSVLRYHGRVPMTLLVSILTDLFSVSVNPVSQAMESNVKVNGGSNVR